ncbi:MAG: regulatory protein [Actinomycetota bacterium]|nr:regulatory protein [Actinomycetota bacterium]
MPRGQAKNPKDCRERALGLLAVRPRSRQELERRLSAAGFERREVADVLGRLEGVGLIDDLSFAQQLAAHHLENRKSGSRAVASALAAKGVSRSVADEVLEGVAVDDEERAFELAASKAVRMGALPPEKAYARLVGLLARRGYGPQIARSAARRALDLQGADQEP